MQIRRRRVTRDSIPALAGPPPGSVRIQTASGSWLLSTASNSLLVNQTTCSVCFTFCLNSGGASGGNILGRTGTQGFDIFAQSGTNKMSLWVFNVASNQYHFTATPGQVYFVALSYTPTASIWYLQAQQVAYVASPGNTEATTDSWFVGWSTATAVDISINQIGIWHGYAMSQADALYIRSGGSPQAIAPANLAAYWSMSGPFGANPNPSTDAGVRDATGNGHNFTLAGTSSLTTYGSPLVYSPPTLVTPYISKSGQTAYFFPLTAAGAIQSVSSIAANPTVQVNFGGSSSPQPVQAQGPYWLPGGSSLTYVTYQLSCGPVQSVVVQNGGSGYVSPTATVTGGGGSGCTLSVTESAGVVTAVTVTSPARATRRHRQSRSPTPTAPGL